MRFLLPNALTYPCLGPWSCFETHDGISLPIKFPFKKRSDKGIPKIFLQFMIPEIVISVRDLSTLRVTSNNFVKFIELRLPGDYLSKPSHFITPRTKFSI